MVFGNPTESTLANSSNSNDANPVSGADPGDEKKHLNIKVAGAGFSEMFFKIKTTTQLKKLMDAYAEKQGKNVSSLRFLYDGDRVNATDTPEKLGIENEDVIEVRSYQVGGLFFQLGNICP